MKSKLVIQLASLKKNLGFQTAYQVIKLGVPLITAPYLARVLGAEQLGIFSYTNSIIQYFILFAMLGIIAYGTRSIAAARDDKQELIKVFSGIYGMQFLTASFISILYIIYLFFFCPNNLLIASIQIIYLIDCILNISWYFFGIEQFKTVLIRDFLVKVFTIVLILLFVNESTDLWIYVSIVSFSNFFSEMLLWINLPKECFRIPKCKDVIGHFKPNILLFIPLLAMSVYHIMDKTMLGILSDAYQSGYYYNADKIINVPVCIISGINIVFLPRISALFAQNKIQEANNMFMISLQSVILIASAIGFGIMTISKEFVPFFLGAGYEECIFLLVLMGPILIIKGYALTVREEFLIPRKLESKYIASVIFGAIVNFIANLSLIPLYGAVGAAIGTIIAEIGACLWQYLSIVHYISLKRVVLKTTGYVCCGFVMYFVCNDLNFSFNANNIINLLIKILSGALVYTMCILICWKIFGDEVVDLVLKRRLLK